MENLTDNIKQRVIPMERVCELAWKHNNPKVERGEAEEAPKTPWNPISMQLPYEKGTVVFEGYFIKATSYSISSPAVSSKTFGNFFNALS